MVAISVKDIHKSFRVYYDKGQSFKEKILFKNRNRYENREVLKGVSFDVKKGEAIGLIGQNGCGKSTLLKLMTKIIYPDQGSITMNGRISSLIELGAGFHPDMSGRENIYTNASIFGLNKKEIDRRIKSIIDFSELEEFIDNPVRTYSSGMYMRLAFAVAINVDADILLIDEILAVGDANFQAKCFNKLREIKAAGTTIVIVSHSMGQIEQICERSIWIEDGKIRRIGSPRDVHPAYLDFMGQKTIVSEKKKQVKNNSEEENQEVVSSNKVEDKNRWGNGEVTIKKVSLLDSDDKESYVFKTGDPMKIKIEYTSVRKIENVNVGIGIFRNDDLQCYGTNTYIDRLKNTITEGDGFIICNLLENNLLKGEYFLDIAFTSDDSVIAYDYWKKLLKFNMYSTIDDAGVTRLTHEWSFNNEKAVDVTKSEIKYDKLTKYNNNILNEDFLKTLKNKLNNMINIYGDENRVHIAKTAQMVNTLFNVSSGHIYVGDFTFTGHNVSIITETHYINKFIEKRMDFPKEGNNIKIGKGVWICSNATILGPCEIGDNSVIAAGAVVTPNTVVPPNSVFGGVPAKKLRDIKLEGEEIV